MFQLTEMRGSALPAHPFNKTLFVKVMDCRVKPGNDDRESMSTTAIYKPTAWARRARSSPCSKQLGAHAFAHATRV